MSCYEWERGEIRLPRSCFSSFKRDLIEIYNSYMDLCKVIADELYSQVLIESKNKRNFNYHFAITERIYDTKALDRQGARLVTNSMLPLNKQGKPKKPKLKDFPKLTNKADRIGRYIHLDRKTRTLIWDVQENNHACETARSSHMGVALFKLLSRVDWKNGSGGIIVGNDEYNRVESFYEGGGANYVKTIFGSEKYWRSNRY